MKEVSSFYVIQGKKLDKNGKEVNKGFLAEAWNTGGMMCVQDSLTKAYSFKSPEEAKTRILDAEREINGGYNPGGGITEFKILKITITTEYEEI